MGSSEDELAQALIRSHRESQEEEKELNPDADDIGVYPEAHYNYYGNRGVADLYLTIGDWYGQLYELKSKAALQEVTGANAIIRQFNQMREYFFEGSQHQVPTNTLIFELCFTPSETNIRHLAKNADLYASLPEQEFVDMEDGEPRTHITVRDSNNLMPIVFFGPNIDFREGIGMTSFLDYAKSQNTRIVKRFEETFDDIC